MKRILKWGGIALVVLIVIGVIGSMGSKSTNNTPNNTPSNPTTTPEPKKQQAEQLHGQNEIVQDGDLAFTVTGVEKTKTLGNQYSKKDAQGEFYVITLKIENKGNKTATFDSSMAKVVDDQGREFERSIEGQTAQGMAQGNVDLFLQQVQPSLSKTGNIVFDLPTDIKNPILLVKGSYFGNGAKIRLQ